MRQALMSLNYFLKLLYKYKKYVVITVLVTVIVAEIFTIFEKPEYKLKTQWMLSKMVAVKPKGKPPKRSNGSNLLLSSYDYKPISTSLEAEILKSEPLIKELYKRAQVPTSYYVFRNNLGILGEIGPYLTIRYNASSEEEVKRVLKIAEDFLFTYLKIPEETTHKKNVQLLEKLAESAHQELIASQLKLQNKEINYQTIIPEARSNLNQSNISMYEDLIAILYQHQKALETTYRSKLSQLKVFNMQEAIDRSNLAANINVTSTLSALNDEKMNLVKLKTTYTDTHKEVQESQNRISQLEEHLQNVYSKALNRTVSKSGVKRLVPFTPIQVTLTNNIVKTELESKGVKAQIKVYEDLLKEETTRLAKSSDYKYELTFLRLDVFFKQKKLALLLNYLNSEQLKLGLSQNSYIFYLLKEPFIKKIRPNYIGNFFYALMLGLLVSCFQVLLLEKFSPKVVSSEYIKESGLKIVGTISNTEKLIYSSNLKEDELKEYFSFSIFLNHLKNNEQKQVFTVIPTTLDNSHTILLANFAYLIAKNGFKAVLLDLNLNNPEVDKLFSVSDKTINIVSIVEQNIENLEDIVLKPEEPLKLDIIISQKTDQLTKEIIFTSGKLKTIINKLKENYDYVFINISGLEDIKLLKFVEYPLLLIKMNKTNKDYLKSILRSFSAKITDCII